MRKKNKATKYFLGVGILYLNKPYRLEGTENDIFELNHFFHHKYKFDESIIITDNSILKPTKKTIMNNFKDIVSKLKSGDTFIFAYSGHGRRLQDNNNDEKDGIDEYIFTSDEQNILDDEINTLLEKIPVGVKTILIFDACYSSSLSDLPYSFTTKNIINNSKKLESSIFSISSSLDSQVSYELLNKSGQIRGALIQGLLYVLSQKNDILTYKKLILDLRKYMNLRNLSQIPTLSSSKPFVWFDTQFLS